MLLMLTLAGILGAGAMGPGAFGAVPSPRQIAHTQMETYAFLHFSPNTFTNREWGNGDEDPNLFNPDKFDPDQIILALKAAGMKGAILTCKHHDGFCLWPTKTTDHSIASSSWKGGKGDVVKEISQACKRHGLKFGVYLSPWDRNNAHYGQAEYVKIYRAQLHELLTQYGPIFEVWHDGANGGSGYYGGAKETRSIDRKTYYGWPETWEMVRKLQPNACIFSDVGPDLRWVGNESGYAAETSWATYDPVGEKDDAPAPGYVKSEQGEGGTKHGTRWLPAECDVSIRPGWFWHASEDDKVKTPAQLEELYYKSVGRGGSFLLNVPPNKHGLVSDSDITSLTQFGSIIKNTFADNLALGARCQASNVRGGDSAFAASNILSKSASKYWTTDNAVTSGSVELDLKKDQTFNVIRLREAIQLGQRVEAVSVDAWQNGDWKEIATATSVGACRLIRLPESVTTGKVRLRVTQSAACPVLYDFGLFLRG